MVTLEKYYNRFKIKNLSKHEEIVFEIFEDLMTRKGLRNEMEDLEEETKNEMLEEYLLIVKSKL